MKNSNEFKVLIAGGGLGGLCLAQGLKKAGIAYKVFERDASPTSRLQGYRLSMTPEGTEALHENLPAQLWERIKEVCTDQIEGINFVSEQLEEKFFKKTPDPIDDVHRFGSISRVALRDILLTELGDTVEFNKRITGYELLENGKVKCLFEDGTSEEGDLLVGTEGTNSVIRTQLLPNVDRVETGVSAIAGQVLMDEQTRQDFLPAPLKESAVVIDSKPQGLFLASHELDAGAEGENYVFWSFLTKRENFPANLETLSPKELVALVDTMTEGWHPRLKSLIRRADLKTVLLLKYKTSVKIARWPVGTVTLLGDSIHSMPPTNGQGANTALQDAQGLVKALTEYVVGTMSLHDAVDQYEDAMFDYAFKAVENSMTNLNRMVTRK